MHPTRHVLLSVVVLAFLAVSQVTLAQVPLQFVTVPPCRVVDTRLAIGPFGGPSMPGQTSRDFAIPNDACNIPSTAEAYSLNVTVVPRPTLGYLTVWPTGQTQPKISTLNSPDGRVKANAAIVPAGTPISPSASSSPITPTSSSTLTAISFRPTTLRWRSFR